MTTRKRSVRFQWSAVLAATGMLAVPATAQLGDANPPASDNPSETTPIEHRGTPPGLYIGPIAGLTTAWHLAPEQTSMPLGTTLVVRTMVDPEADVTWTGAVEVRRDDSAAYAICPLPEVGLENLTVHIETGGSTFDYACQMVVVDVSVDQIRVSARVHPSEPVDVDPTLPPEELNRITMGYYFGDSIASIRRTTPERYVTSIDNLVNLFVEVQPLGFTPLMEWRIDGEVVRLGATASTMIEETGMTSIGDLPGGIYLSDARAVSRDGSRVVGLSATASGPEAFLWTEGEGMISLGDLPGGSHAAAGLGISGDGSIVVGFGNSDLGDQAFIWDETNGVRILQDVLVDDHGLDLDGWQLLRPRGITPDGTVIVGLAINPDGNDEAWRVTLPVPSNPADVNADGQVDVEDLVAVITGWGPCPDPPDDCPADVDGNGVVNVLDLVAVIVSWT